MILLTLASRLRLAGLLATCPSMDSLRYSIAGSCVGSLSFLAYVKYMWTGYR